MKIQGIINECMAYVQKVEYSTKELYDLEYSNHIDLIKYMVK